MTEVELSIAVHFPFNIKGYERERGRCVLYSQLRETAECDFALNPRELELELELIQTQMTQKPMLRAEVGMRVRCANKACAECIMRGRGIGQNSRKNCKKRGICG